MDNVLRISQNEDLQNQVKVAETNFQVCSIQKEQTENFM